MLNQEWQSLSAENKEVITVRLRNGKIRSAIARRFGRDRYCMSRVETQQSACARLL